MTERCDHPHSGGEGLHGPALGRALDRAAARCDAEGERMTTARRRVLELLLAAGQPVKAYDLIAAFGADGEAAKPPTVYRALDFLERQGLAHRIASLSAYVACGRDQVAHAAAFLICDCCGATREIETAGELGLADQAARCGYALTRTTIEAHGLCEACRGAR